MEKNQLIKSVFIGGKKTTKAQFTKKWIEMVNKMEKNKGIPHPGREA